MATEASEPRDEWAVEDSEFRPSLYIKHTELPFGHSIVYTSLSYSKIHFLADGSTQGYLTPRLVRSFPTIVSTLF
jgi:hypothetical protein